MPSGLVAHDLDLGKTVTSEAAEMISTMLAEKHVVGLGLFILYGNILYKGVNMAQNDHPTFGVRQKWNPFERLH
jgi:hypothetical protein